MRTVWVMGLIGLWLVGSSTFAQKTKPASGQKSGLGAGLKGEYFSGPNFEKKVLTRTDAQVDFNWNWESPGPNVPREYFSVRWTGKLYAPTSGTYRFSATVDDGVRVWVGGKKVIDEWRKQDDSRFVGEISLNGKQLYDLRIEYYNDWKGSVISVFWESPENRRLLSFASTPRQLIPAKYLFSRPVRPLASPPAVARREPPTVLTPVAPKTTNRPADKRTTTELAALKPVATRTQSKAAPIPVPPTVPPSSPKPVLAAVMPEAVKPTPVTPEVEPFGTLSAGKAVVLRHVAFTQSEYTLLPESYPELNRLVRVMQTNPALNVQISGHTDNVGDKRLNQTLSEFRAKVVANYLIRHDIAATRITHKGYGGSRPIIDNASEEQRAQNRRVEFVVTE